MAIALPALAIQAARQKPQRGRSRWDDIDWTMAVNMREYFDALGYEHTIDAMNVWLNTCPLYKTG